MIPYAQSRPPCAKERRDCRLYRPGPALAPKQPVPFTEAPGGTVSFALPAGALRGRSPLGLPRLFQPRLFGVFRLQTGQAVPRLPAHDRATTSLNRRICNASGGGGGVSGVRPDARVPISRCTGGILCRMCPADNTRPEAPNSAPFPKRSQRVGGTFPR